MLLLVLSIKIIHLQGIIVLLTFMIQVLILILLLRYHVTFTLQINLYDYLRDLNVKLNHNYTCENWRHY